MSPTRSRGAPAAVLCVLLFTNFHVQGGEPLRLSAAAKAANQGGLRLRRTSAAGDSQTVDIALETDGLLTGRFVNADGNPIDGAVVTLTRNSLGIARTTTDREGVFRIPHVPSGTFRLVCGSAGGHVRCWSSDAAPPHALAGTLTFQDGLVRGQAGFLAPALSTNVLVSGAAATGAAVGGASLAATDASSRQSRRTPASEAATADTLVGINRPTNLLAGYDRVPRLVASSDPNGSVVETRKVDGQLVKVVKSTDNRPFEHDFGDPRDAHSGSGLRPLVPADLQDFPPADILDRWNDDRRDPLPASP